MSEMNGVYFYVISKAQSLGLLEMFFIDYDLLLNLYLFLMILMCAIFRDIENKSF